DASRTRCRSEEWHQLVDIFCDTTIRRVPVIPPQAAMYVLPDSRSIVFVQVVDPVGGGLVESLAHPGGNATGFTSFEYSLSANWLQLLKEIAPHVTRVAVIAIPREALGSASSLSSSRWESCSGWTWARSMPWTRPRSSAGSLQLLVPRMPE